MNTISHEPSESTFIHMSKNLLTRLNPQKLESRFYKKCEAHATQMICCIEAPFTLTGEENTQLAQSRVGRVDGRNRREQSNQKVNKKRQNGGRTQFDVIFSPLARYLRLLFRHETTGYLQQQLKTIQLFFWGN